MARCTAAVSLTCPLPLAPKRRTLKFAFSRAGSAARAEDFSPTAKAAARSGVCLRKIRRLNALFMKLADTCTVLRISARKIWDNGSVTAGRRARPSSARRAQHQITARRTEDRRALPTVSDRLQSGTKHPCFGRSAVLEKK